VSDVLLATKIHIPPLHRSLTNRSHLIRRLNEGVVGDTLLTLISAPAGYGKSTLLSEWVSQTDIPVAWLSLEAGDSSATRFWSYFVIALDTIPHLHRAGIGEPILQALRSPQSPPMDSLLVGLVNDLSRLEGDAVLVLDDLHTIKERHIHQDLAFLVDHLPRSTGNLHLVVASRMDPPWPLARWRARGQLAEIRTADLRFSLEEATDFLNRVMQLGLSAEDLRILGNRTEGWIAGLQMAALSLQGRLREQGPEAASRFVASFGGSNRFILDYLMEEVLSQQPAEMRDFLLNTSILERLAAPLCDALLGRRDSQAFLDEAEQTNLFLIPLDDERHWYRYHHLFAEHLRRHLGLAQREAATELHQRASAWCAENGLLSEAISHALDAGDIVRVNDLVSGNALVMAEATELADVQSHFEDLPEEVYRLKPWLCVARAWVKAYVDPSRGLDPILRLAEQSLEAEANPVNRQRLTGQLDAIRAYAVWMTGDPDEALASARRALDALPEDDWMARARLLNIQGLALLYTENLASAVQSFEAALALGQRVGALYEIFIAQVNLSYIAYLQGRLHQAFSYCQRVLDVAARSGEAAGRMPVLAYAYATMSLVRREWNEAEPAIADARAGVALAEGWKQADALHFALSCLSKALALGGDLEAAYAANQRATQLALQVSPWFYQLSVYDKVELDLATGDTAAAERGLVEVEALCSERDKKYTFLLRRASLLYAQRDYGGLLTGVERAVVDLERRGLIQYVVDLLPLQALALQALGRQEEALDVTAHCLDLAAPEGFVRVFVERGSPMLRLLQGVADRGIRTEAIGKLLPTFDLPEASGLSRPRPVPRGQVAFPSEPLSERETQVLRLLDSALTAEEIGRELYLSVNTVRTHIRSIYGKLAVHGRIEAVQKARECGLI
jgi:LuxR family maltose regulon positive regulatory protein